jgi:hypothetical protein
MKSSTAQSMKCGHDSRWTTLFDHPAFISLAGIIRVSIAAKGFGRIENDMQKCIAEIKNAPDDCRGALFS